MVNIEWIAKACTLCVTHFGGIYHILQPITIYSIFEILVKEVGGYLVFWSTPVNNIATLQHYN